MPLLRKISKPKWYNTPWMPAGQIQADALVDLRTAKNELSVWRVEADESNLPAVIAALASKTSKIDRLDYVLLDEDALNAVDIKFVKSDGDSPHLDANKKWHFDLVELTAAKVIEIAKQVKQREHDHQRLFPARVREILRDALQNDKLERSAIDPELVSEIGGG